jgi:transcriptional regulator with XRE-family HTH domain
MNFSLLQERLRTEIKRRIDRKLLTGAALAAQTGLRPSHISNFLHRKRNLSLAALDQVLSALSLNVFDFAPHKSTDRLHAAPSISNATTISIPLVAHAAAIHSPVITRSIVQQALHLPAASLDQRSPRSTAARRDWHRFVAVRLNSAEALPMFPVLHPESIVVLDRHYRTLLSCSPPRPNVYGVSSSGSLLFRYVERSSGQLILRPHAVDHPVESLEIADQASPLGCIVGRVCICISQL